MKKKQYKPWHPDSYAAQVDALEVKTAQDLHTLMADKFHMYIPSKYDRECMTPDKYFSDIEYYVMYARHSLREHQLRRARRIREYFRDRLRKVKND